MPTGPNLVRTGKHTYILRKKKSKKPKTAPNRITGLNKIEKKQVKNIVANRKESKYCPNWFQYDDFETTGGFIQPAISSSGTLPGIFNAGNLACSVVGLQMGNYLTSASAEVNTLLGAGTVVPLGGIGMERGDLATNIDGDYAYLQSSKLQLRISARVLGEQGYEDTQCLPLEFRLIQIRPKANTPSGTTPSLVSSLFVDNHNVAEGLGASGTVTEVMQNWRLNRNQFEVVKDMHFQLSNVMQPSIPTQGGPSISQTMPQITAYPNTKDIELWMNNPKKRLRFANNDNGSTSYYEPTNYQYQEYVIILCARKYINQAGPVFKPLSTKFWEVRTNGMTKYRDS